MQRKMASFLIVILFCCINKLNGEYWKNGITDVDNVFSNCTVVKAAEDIEDIKEDGEAKGLDKEEKTPSSEKNNAVDEVAEKKEAPETEQAVNGEETEKSEKDEKTEEDDITNEAEESCIYNVAFPTGTKAFLDPDNLSGRGQIFSDDFKVENYGNTDVAIKIKNIEVYYRSTEDVYEFSEEKVSDHHSHIKKLNVDVVWKNEVEKTERVLNVLEGISDKYVLFLKASKYDENGSFAGPSDGSTGSFYFTGTLNSNPELVWEDGEVQISFDYEIENIEEDVVQEEQKQQESIEDEDMALLPGLPVFRREAGQQEELDSGKKEEQKENSEQEVKTEQGKEEDAGVEAEQGKKEDEDMKAEQGKEDEGMEVEQSEKPDIDVKAG